MSVRSDFLHREQVSNLKNPIDSVEPYDFSIPARKFGRVNFAHFNHKIHLTRDKAELSEAN